MKELKSGPLISGVALAMILGVIAYRYTYKPSSQIGASAISPTPSDFKDLRIRDRLTVLLAELSSSSVGVPLVEHRPYHLVLAGEDTIAAIQANLDAIMSVESGQWSAKQQDLLHEAIIDLRLVWHNWREFQLHAPEDDVSPEEAQKAKLAAAELREHINSAKQEIADAAKTF